MQIQSIWLVSDKKVDVPHYQVQQYVYPRVRTAVPDTRKNDRCQWKRDAAKTTLNVKDAHHNISASLAMSTNLHEKKQSLIYMYIFPRRMLGQDLLEGMSKQNHNRRL